MTVEYDDARSGGLEPLAAMPDDRTVVLGFVTTRVVDINALRALAPSSLPPRS
jgi:hypothetical protein